MQYNMLNTVIQHIEHIFDKYQVQVAEEAVVQGASECRLFCCLCFLFAVCG